MSVFHYCIEEKRMEGRWKGGHRTRALSIPSTRRAVLDCFVFTIASMPRHSGASPSFQVVSPLLQHLQRFGVSTPSIPFSYIILTRLS